MPVPLWSGPEPTATADTRNPPVAHSPPLAALFAIAALGFLALVAAQTSTKGVDLKGYKFSSDVARECRPAGGACLRS